MDEDPYFVLEADVLSVAKDRAIRTHPCSF